MRISMEVNVDLDIWSISNDDELNNKASLFIPSAFQMQELAQQWLATLCPQKSYNQHQGCPHLVLYPLTVTVHRGTVLQDLLDESKCHWGRLAEES